MSQIAHVRVKVETGEDDKEVGVFSVRLFQGGHKFEEFEFGDDEDWNEGHVEDEDIDVSGPTVNGKPIRCVVALEERPGQKNITWDSKIRVEVHTDDGRSVVFNKKIRFDTDHNKPEHVRGMGSKSFGPAA